MARTKNWFPTLIYSAPLGAGVPALNRELIGDVARIRAADTAGRRWSKTGYPGGYTSYGSLDRLHRLSSSFADLQKRIDRHVKVYARALGWKPAPRLVMTDCWVNVMPQGCAHSFHLHPQSVISGTYYVRTPRGTPGLKFEDPRLSRFMAAPPRLAHLTYPARAGEVILFESWLRHEVPANPVDRERVSISFNYHLGSL